MFSSIIIIIVFYQRIQVRNKCSLSFSYQIPSFLFQVVLKEHLVLTLFRDEVGTHVLWRILVKISKQILTFFIQQELLHEDYQLYVLPSILESKKLAKSGRSKQKEADLEYNVAKQVEKMIRFVL